MSEDNDEDGGMDDEEGGEAMAVDGPTQLAGKPMKGKVSSWPERLCLSLRWCTSHLIVHRAGNCARGGAGITISCTPGRHTRQTPGGMHDQLCEMSAHPGAMHRACLFLLGPAR